MKIAIFQEQLYHTEIFGFIFDYLTKKNILNIDIYYENPGYINSYINFYLSIYKNINPTFYKPSEITQNQIKYDKIIFTTNPKSNFKINYSNKTIIIIHRIDQFIKNAINIGLTKLTYDKCFINPLFAYNFKFKKNFTKNILIMGNLGHKNISDLINNIDKFDNYNFIVISRCLNKLKELNKKNLILFENIQTQKIIDLFSNDIDYLLLLNKNPSIYHKKCITGCIFQGLSFGIPVICDKKYYDIYKYPGSIVYNNSIVEILNKINLLNIDDYNILQHKIINFNKNTINYNFNYLNNILKSNNNFNNIINDKEIDKKKPNYNHPQKEIKKLLNKDIIKVKIKKN